MAILGFLSKCMSERNILFSQLGVACFPVRLIELIPLCISLSVSLEFQGGMVSL